MLPSFCEEDTKSHDSQNKGFIDKKLQRTRQKVMTRNKTESELYKNLKMEVSDFVSPKF